MKQDDFEGVIGRLYADSKEAWKAERSDAAAKRPNVVFIVLDDVGFSDIGCYGSEIDTPHMNRLGLQGAHYNNFHVTAMCSPTRACVLTGRNAHSVGMGVISEWAGGFPGYEGRISDRAATIAEILRDNGYSTMGVGKWHLTPMKDVSAAGPYGNWPLGRGFDRWYGFQGAFTDQWNPELYEDNHPIDTPLADGYHLSEDLVDRSIAYIDNQQAARPDKPFFLYLAFGACHWPHHVPAGLVDKYKGRFSTGWDVVRERRYLRQKELGVIPPDTALPPANPGVPAWSSLSDDERRFCERSQELYAAFLDHTDQQIGRLLAFLEARGVLDNTLIVLLSDNGASPEGGPLGVVALNARKHLYHGPESAAERAAALDTLGGPTTYPHYAFGWAQASNTPLQWYKMNTYGGGVRAPLLVHWPNGIPARGLRSQYHHAIDLLPTVLDVIGIEAPASYRGVAQIPVQGTSLRYSFDAARCADPQGQPVLRAERRPRDLATRLEGGHAPQGRHRLRRRHLGAVPPRPRLLRVPRPVEGASRQAARAGRPLVVGGRCPRRACRSTTAGPRAPTSRRATPSAGRTRFYPGLERVDRIKAPDMTGRSYSIRAEVDVPAGGAEGVLLAFGTALAGYVLYVKDGRLVHEHVFSGSVRQIVRSERRDHAGPPCPAIRVRAARRRRRARRCCASTARRPARSTSRRPGRTARSRAA